jgi:hypothetical protein
MVKPVATKDLSGTIDPTVMAKYYDLKPDKSAYYVAYDDDEDKAYTTQFDPYNSMLVTIFAAQPLYSDEIDRIEVIDVDTFDD